MSIRSSFIDDPPLDTRRKAQQKIWPNQPETHLSCVRCLPLTSHHSGRMPFCRIVRIQHKMLDYHQIQRRPRRCATYDAASEV